MARNIECQCDSRFTCGYCLRNAKPYFFTLSDGSGIYEIPLQGRTSKLAATTNAPKLGRKSYEADVAKTPRYHDGAPRKTWEQLREVEQWSWTRPVRTEV